MIKTNINAVFWTLKIEIYASLLLPFYLALRRKSGFSALLVFLFLLLAPFWLTQNEQNLFLFNAFLFLIGAEIENLARLAKAFVPYHSTGLHLAGALLVVSSALLPRQVGLSAEGVWQYIFYQNTFRILSGGGAMLIIMDIVRKHEMSAGIPLLRLRWFRFLGKVSYSLYLMHPCAIVVALAFFRNRICLGIAASRVLVRDQFAFLGSVLAMTLVISVACYYLVEKPSVRLSRVFSRT
jgi:peptidoglycan/LPS O-acetylase OafA/YrhL